MDTIILCWTFIIEEQDDHLFVSFGFVLAQPDHVRPLTDILELVNGFVRLKFLLFPFSSASYPFDNKLNDTLRPDV